MISALVPYRSGEEFRDESWAWNRRRWEMLLPEVEVIVGEEDGGDDPGHYNHPLAINRAAKQASGNVFVIADADTAFDPAWILEAARLITEDGAPWVLPTWYDKLNHRSSRRILGMDPDYDITANLDRYRLEWRGESVAWSGMVVVPREAFEAVGGYDERYAKWGADDMAFGLSMDTLWGPHTRLPGSCFHFWHPAPLSQTYGHDRHREQYDLGERYKAAAGDPAAMTEVRFG
jgi:hypothetical protein